MSVLTFGSVAAPVRQKEPMPQWDERPMTGSGRATTTLRALPFTANAVLHNSEAITGRDWRFLCCISQLGFLLIRAEKSVDSSTADPTQ
jgi:hypothetical protein